MFSVFGLLVLLTVMNAGCSRPVSLISYWNEKSIKIDGVDDDWEKNKMEIIKDSKIAVGILCDKNYVYLGIAPLERSAAMQILTMGFTIWFDSTGKGDKILGIRYPIGMSGGRPMTPADYNQSENPFDIMAKKELNKVEIIGPGKLDRTRLTQYELSGISVKLTHQKDGMFYEVKVPLRPSDNCPYAINATSGKPITILLETGEFKKPEFAGRMPGGQGGGRMPAGGMPMGGPPEMPKKMKVLIKTNLPAM
jgi:hypothetical protein